jgi:hypothetical protein
MQQPKTHTSLCTIAVVLSAYFSWPAHAHVKWFVAHDVAQAPLPIGQVITGTFTTLLLVMVACVYFFFLVSTIRRGQWRKSGFVVLFASTGLTLIWASVEKFAYPHWTYPMLAENPGMLMGMQPYHYTLLAGFIEFGVTFVLLGAVSVLGRLVALGLQTVFVLAILKFGMIDAIGHLMIIATLFVLVVRGPTDAREMLVLRDKAVWTEAYFMTGLCFLALNMIFILYYGLHHLAYGK